MAMLSVEELQWSATSSTARLGQQVNISFLLT